MRKFEAGDICIWKPKKVRSGFYGLSHPEAARPCEVIISSGPSKRGYYLCEFIHEADRKTLMPKCGRLRITESSLEKYDRSI